MKSPDRAESVMLAFADTRPRFGLLELWKEQAAEIKARSEGQPGAAQELAAAQKSAAGWRNQPDKPGPFQIRYRKPEACKCGNRGLAEYGDTWRCNACGASGSTVIGEHLQ